MRSDIVAALVEKQWAIDNPTSEPAHMPQLDALRAIAFLAVAVSHWTPNFLNEIVPWGTGVQLFFVLSGFLITGILLRSRPADVGLSLGSVLRVFYLRRFLRIFPLYYGVLTLSLIFAVGPIYQTWPWHFAYLSNVFYAWHGHTEPRTDPFLHLWSLSVEEQFYLLWPMAALLASRRAFLILLYVAIVIAVPFRLGAAHFLPDLQTVRYLPSSCLDAFAVGGLIAHTKHYTAWDGIRRLARALALTGIAGLVLSSVVLVSVLGFDDARHVGHTFLVICFGAVVAQAAVGFTGLPGRLLQCRPLRYLGKISYGLYVYHYFAPIVLNSLTSHWGFSSSRMSPPITLFFYSVFTVCAAVVSWHFYELPINNLKRRFEYPRSQN